MIQKAMRPPCVYRACLCLIAMSGIIAGLAGAVEDAIITSVTPSYGSLNGGTRITVYGTGFAENQFNFLDDPDLGNEVQLVSMTSSYVCDIHKDGCTETQLMCYTRRMPEGDYFVRVFVDGDKVLDENLCSGPWSSACSLKVRDDQTPKVKKISPSTSFPGSMLNVDAKMFTDIFESSKEEASNGRAERVVRSYMGGQTCEIRDFENDRNYNLALALNSDQETYSDDGQIECKLRGTYIGNQNYSFIVDGQYGRSIPELDVLWVTAQNKITMHQTYAEVTGVSPTVGSVVGGTLMTISGNYFDDTDAPIQVSVAGQPCSIIEQYDTEIICETMAQTISNHSYHPGNRGFMKLTWNGTDHYDLDLQAVPSVDDLPLQVEHLDGFSWQQVAGHSDSPMDEYITYFRGFFVPPSDNDYKFYLLSDDEAQLWMEEPENATMMKIAENTRARTRYEDDGQTSRRMSLIGGNPYLLEVYHKDHRGDAYVRVGVHMYHTVYTGDQAGPVKNEIQVLETTSSVVYEQQSVHIGGWSTQSGTDEEQVIDLRTSSPGDTVFRLGVYGVYTGPLNGLVSSNDLKSELNLLPSIAPETVSVVAENTAGGRRFTVTFNSQRGEWPNIVGLEDPTSVAPVSFSVSTSTPGVASMRYLVMGFDGVPSPPLYGDSVSASSMEVALTEMFSARCPRTITNPMGKKFQQTYDKVTDYPESGQRVMDAEPFCGRYSSLNPSHIYYRNDDMKEINIFNYPFLCFAYKGGIQDLIQLKYTGDSTHWRTFEVTYTQGSGWQYQCIDLASLVSELHPLYSTVILDIVNVFKNTSADLYIDEVFIGSTEPTNDPNFGEYRRLVPQQWIGEEVDVVDTGDDTFNVTFRLYECAHNLPLLTVEHAQLQGGSTNDQAVYTADTWPTGVSVEVRRVQAAGRPIQGTFSLIYQGHSLDDIPAAVEPDELQDLLESLPNIGKVSVVQTGDCYGYTWSIEWKTEAGDHPELVLDASHITGSQASMTVSTLQDGGVFFDPIPGDMLKTTHDLPQVVVTVNNVPSKCTGNCSYSWEQDSTPTLTGTSPASGSVVMGTTLIISGTGFVSDVMGNNVTIGGVACDLTSATSMELQCDVGEGPAGSHDVVVYVDQKGWAEHVGGTHQFTYNFAVTGLDPVTGGLGGGTTLNLTGTGFGPDVRVSVGTEECQLLTAEYDLLSCRTPLSTTAGVEQVVVTEGAESVLAPFNFTYDGTLTPLITQINDTQALVGGGSVIIVEGSGFGSVLTTDDSVLIGETPADVTSYSDTEIVLTLPSLPVGVYQLLVTVGNQGYGVYSSNGAIPEIEYQLSVTSMTPDGGSLYGGTYITLTGTGFGSNIPSIQVSVGDTPCTVTSILTTEIVCTLEDPAPTHLITNQGMHPDYGTGYAWSPLNMDVAVGDTVLWRWTTPDLVVGVGYLVERTASPTARGYAGSGFQSGTTKTANGYYAYKFGSVGTYYYWSGPVDSDGLITMRGVVNVIERESSTHPVQLLVASHEAIYDLTDTSSRRKRSVACSAVTSDINGCAESTRTNSSSGQFMFEFSTCLTPTVKEITPISGPLTSSITISGTGFGEEDCQNEVKIGDYPCNVTSSSSTAIACTIDHMDTMPVGVPYTVIVSVNNRGSALVEIENDVDRSFILLPHVSDVSPSSGSVKGGTILTISGGGFVDGGTSVQIGGVSCEVVTVSYMLLTCLTPNAVEMSSDVEVYVYSRGQFIPSECTGSCSYSFYDGDTPKVTGVSPTEVTSEGQILTLTGSVFSSVPADNTVLLGDTPCVVQSATSSELQCNVGQPIAGDQTLSVLINNKGYSSNDIVAVTVTPGDLSLSQSSGSLGGGTELTITGLGFALDSSVNIDGNPCDITLVTPTSIECSTPPGAEDTVDVNVQSNTFTYTAVSFTYSTSVTPVLVSVSPTSGSENDTITITGTNILDDLGLVSVEIGETPCSVAAMTTTTISCVLGVHSAGDFEVSVFVEGWGYATGAVSFTYELEILGVSPGTGSFGGGQVVTIAGRGFADNITTVEICDLACEVTDVPSSVELVCLTPSHTGSGTASCDVVVTVNDLTETTLTSGYMYDDSITPTISGVAPQRGGTGGGTSVTISGSGFGTSSIDVMVSIAGTVCSVDSVVDDEIICTTGAHKPSIESEAIVSVSQQGNAKQTTSGAAAFQYIDVWSSRFTWNDMDPPVAGDFVIVPADMTVLLDTSTPVLKILLIQGGKVIFDEMDIELQAEIILITDGGLLQVGTEDEPFQHKAVITLHGHVKSKELPIYGTKCIAVREGTLDLHGSPSTTWTRLGATANVNDDQITLEASMGWAVNDEIIIATTGLRHSQGESEQRTITAVSGDGMTLTLDEPLQYKHLGESIGLTGQSIRLTGSESISETLEARAEVGLLTHNVVVRGSDDDQWHDEIEPCPEGFNTGEFVTQTCFQGRFGEEIGSNQFGGHIIMHAPRYDEELVVARIENVELTHVGQAFRLGRYAIHFHLNGDMPSSYIRGCSIHKGFNRAVNIHHSHYITIEHNVAYKIMGGAFFLEDGIEIGNVFQYNLAVLSMSSTSLQNDDITPAAYWITNPNNTVQHNHAAGGTHFGFWYRMHEHPGGPSFDPDICPQRTPLGVFQNNTVHSQGWFGIWIFQHYYPMVGGDCDTETSTPARFYGLTAWNNEKGAEWVGGGAIQFIDFVLVHNEVAGVEMKFIDHLGDSGYTNDGPMIDNNLIVNRAGVLSDAPTRVALILPYGHGLLVRDAVFVNFDQDGDSCFEVAGIDGITKDFCGGYKYKSEGLQFENSANKVYFRWVHDGVFHDLDGSLCGSPGCKVVPDNPSLPPSCSVQDPAFSVNADVPGTTCDQSVDFHRYSFNHAVPESLMYKNVTFTTAHGSTYSPWMKKRFSHAKGWMVVLVDGLDHLMTFENAGHVTNISYEGTVYDFKDSEHIIISHNFTQAPDKFRVLHGDTRNGSAGPLTFSDNINGDWAFDDSANIFSYIISSKVGNSSAGGLVSMDSNVDLNIYQCFYAGCISPSDPNDEPPSGDRPEDYIIWHDASSWDETEAGWGGNYGNGSFGPPQSGDNVKIQSDVWMVVTETIPTLGTLWIYGVLEFEFAPYENGSFRNFILSATHVVISGGRLIVGWENNKFPGNMDIILLGDHMTPDLLLPNGPNLGAKALGVFGGLDLHGLPKVTAWTQLGLTASPGSSAITLIDAVDWSVGDKIVIAPTGFDLEETEVKIITGISADKTTLALDSPLEYEHYMSVEPISPTRTYTMAAEVGLLSRNIRIIGGDYGQLQAQAFGARVLVGVYSIDETVYSGYARLSDVEFYHSGQEGWTDWYDPRYSLAFLSIGDVGDNRPSYVRSCTFHHGFSPAVGVFSTNYLEMSDNVVHHTVGSAIIVTGVGSVIRRNLVVQVVHPGVFNGRNEMQFEWDGGMELLDARDVILQGNTVAGSHRALYRVDGEPCSKLTSSGTDMWSDNVGHSSLMGVEILPEEGTSPCMLLANFTIYRTWDFGIFTETDASVKVINYVSIDNQLGLFPMVINPSATEHEYADKFIDVIDSMFVGTSSVFDCADTLAGPNIEHTDLGRSWTSPDGGRIGLSWPTFSSKSNAAPTMPFRSITSYQALNGIMTLSGVTFTQFSTQCDGKRDYAITTNPYNDDAQHPIEASGITLYNVLEENIVFIHRAQLSKINPSDCVDMECDGLKKAILHDTDGSFLGAPGTVIPESEWAWDQDPRRGLGDYRIPTALLTDQNGNRIPVEDIAPYKGIIRDGSCTYKPDYQAYVCHGLDYFLLHLENMDADTETRRVSPVAVLSDGYLDLLNGPQDHGWCVGYTCQERLSTFPIIMAAGKMCEIYYTGTSPQDTRYHWLNTGANQGVLLSTWYAQTWRLNIFIEGVYVMPTNGYYTPEGQLALNTPTFEGQYVPDITTDPSGTNYFDRETQKLYVLVKGSTPVEVKTDTTIVVTFNMPAMTVDEFFGEKIIQNLAAFFDIPPDKIKYAHAVEESRRKKRDTITAFTIQISNPPRDINATDPTDLSSDEIRSLSVDMINVYQLGQFDAILNLTILSITILEPPPVAGSEEWSSFTSMEVVGATDLQVPKALFSLVDPDPVSEGSVFRIPPQLSMVDAVDALVQQLGSVLDPWHLMVTLEMTSSSDSRATLGGTVDIPFYGNVANFSDLTISHSGAYRLLFEVNHPSEAAFSTLVIEVNIGRRELTGRTRAQPSSVLENDAFILRVELVDMATNTAVEDIGWQNHTWTCAASLDPSNIYPGALVGADPVILDPTTGLGTFTGLTFTHQAKYVVTFRCTSDPSMYDFVFSSDPIMVYSASYSTPAVEKASSVQLRFEGDYDLIAAGSEDQLSAAIHNHLWNRYSNVILSDFSVSSGSILSDFIMSGLENDVTLTLNDLWDHVGSPMTIEFGLHTLVTMPEMTVDGEPFYGEDGPSSSGLDPALLAVIISSSVLVVLIVAGLVVWYLATRLKKKCSTSPSGSRVKLMVQDEQHRKPRPSMYATEEGFGEGLPAKHMEKPEPSFVVSEDSFIGSTVSQDWSQVPRGTGLSSIGLASSSLSTISQQKINVAIPPLDHGGQDLDDYLTRRLPKLGRMPSANPALATSTNTVTLVKKAIATMRKEEP